MENIYLESPIVDFDEFRDMIKDSSENFSINVGLASENFHQTMPEVEEEISLAKKIWLVNSVILGMGFHSMYDCPVSMLSIPATHFREPSEEEIMDDVMNFGDKILKNKKQNGTFLDKGRGLKYDFLEGKRIPDYDDSDYIGPERVLGHFFITNIFYNDISELSDLIKGYDDVPKFDDMTVLQMPEIFFAKRGSIYHQSVNSFKDYNTGNFENLINLLMSDDETLTLIKPFFLEKKNEKFKVENAYSDYKFEDIRDLCEDMFYAGI